MKRPMFLILAAVVATAPLACTQTGSAVKGFESGPGGWQMTGQAQTSMTSDVQYLGASADGLIIVRMADGSAQIWRTVR